MTREEFYFNGYRAVVVRPENPNGKWVWKTEFFTAFDQAEVKLNEMGYTRVYYEISNMYGNDEAVRLMHNFHLEVIKRYNLNTKAFLFGFSRGGLYAFNYALYYPEYVEKIYLDAPVLNLKSWPPKGSKEHLQVLEKFNLSEDAFDIMHFSPIDKLEEFSKLNIPVLIVAGAVDKTVPHLENSQIMVDYYHKHDFQINYILKENCDHHPHSLEDIAPIVKFIQE